MRVYQLIRVSEGRPTATSGHRTAHRKRWDDLERIMRMVSSAIPIITFRYYPYKRKKLTFWVSLLNGAFESFCIVIVFPLLVWLGASGSTSHTVSDRICNFLGDISYPLYIIHYPFMYLFYAWLIDTEKYTLVETWPVVLVLYAGCISVAYLCLKLYDIPVRKWLTNF